MNYKTTLVASLALVVFVTTAGVTTMTDFGRQGLSNAQDAGAAVTAFKPVVAQQSIASTPTCTVPGCPVVDFTRPAVQSAISASSSTPDPAPSTPRPAPSYDRTFDDYGNPTFVVF